jgi:ATP adenylyltransferase
MGQSKGLCSKSFCRHLLGVVKAGAAFDRCSHILFDAPLAERSHKLHAQALPRLSILQGMDRLWTPWRYAYVTGGETVKNNPAAAPKPGVPAALAAWPGDKHCVFCNMLAATAYAVEKGTPPEDADGAAYILWRGQHTFMVLNAFPYNAGHLMVVPYEHQASLAALPEAAASELMTGMRRAEAALRQVYTPHGLNLGLNLGEAAGAGVAHHLHVHAVPRWSGDTNFMSVLAETRVLPEMLGDTYKRLHSVLSEQ